MPDPPRSRPRSGARGPSPAGPPWLAWLASGIFVVVALTVVTVWAFSRGSGPGRGSAKLVSIPEDPTPSAVADALAEAGLTLAPRKMSLYLRFAADVSSFRPGRHVLPDDATPRALRAVLERGDDRLRARVTFPEGTHRFEMARRLEEKSIVLAQDFLAATQDKNLLAELGIPAAHAEGYLFPSTYDLPVDGDAPDVVRRLKRELDVRLAKIKSEHPDFPGQPAKDLGWTVHKLLTLASIVEKEAGVDDERPLVASVFVNRYRDPGFTPKPPRLQSDPTSAYGCRVEPSLPACAGFSGKTTPAMNNDPANAYSSYSHADLPPTPISNPGEASIRAVVAPAETKYLYFVAKGGNRHTFSATLGEHNEAVGKLRDLRRLTQPAHPQP